MVRWPDYRITGYVATTWRQDSSQGKLPDTLLSGSGCGLAGWRSIKNVLSPLRGFALCDTISLVPSMDVFLYAWNQTQAYLPVCSSLFPMQPIYRESTLFTALWQGITGWFNSLWSEISVRSYRGPTVDKTQKCCFLFNQDMFVS